MLYVVTSTLMHCALTVDETETTYWTVMPCDTTKIPLSVKHASGSWVQKVSVPVVQQEAVAAMGNVERVEGVEGATVTMGERAIKNMANRAMPTVAERVMQRVAERVMQRGAERVMQRVAERVTLLQVMETVMATRRPATQ